MVKQWLGNGQGVSRKWTVCGQSSGKAMDRECSGCSHVVVRKLLGSGQGVVWEWTGSGKDVVRE